MNHLLVYAHPHEGSFNNAILDTAVSALRANGHDVHVRHLYQLGFNPVLSPSDTAALSEGNPPADIQTEQEYLAKADYITFIYPIWWTGLPAILKGYVDRTFSHGFAYKSNGEGGIEPLFTGKKGLIVTTCDTPAEIYNATGMTDSLKQTSGSGIFEFCGIEVVDQLLFGGVSSHTPEAVLKDMLVQVENRFSSL